MCCKPCHRPPIQGQWRTVSTALGTAWVGQAIKSEAGHRTPEGSPPMTFSLAGLGYD